MNTAAPSVVIIPSPGVASLSSEPQTPHSPTVADSLSKHHQDHSVFTLPTSVAQTGPRHQHSDRSLTSAPGASDCGSTHYEIPTVSPRAGPKPVSIEFPVGFSDIQKSSPASALHHTSSSSRPEEHTPSISSAALSDVVESSSTSRGAPNAATIETPAIRMPVPEALADLHDVSSISIALEGLSSLDAKLSPKERDIAIKERRAYQLWHDHRSHVTQALRGVLQIASDSLNLAPFAKAVLGGGIVAVRTLEISWENDSASRGVAKSLNQAISTLVHHYQDIQSRSHGVQRAPNVVQGVVDFHGAIEDCVRLWEEFSSASSVSRYFLAPEYASTLGGISKQVSQAIKTLTMRAALNTQVVVAELDLRQAEHLAQTTRHEARWSLKANADALETLDPIYAARHDGDNTIHSCIDRTRVQVIRELKKWTKDSSDPVFWLSGRAGVGKTAVAKTFCRWLVKKKTMGGSFFVNRDDSRRMASSMVRTIAYDLAKNQPKIGQLISGAIVQCPDIISRSIPEQLQTLLMDPLRSVSKESLPVVLVIDGLNDCHRYDGYPAIKLVSTLIMIIRQQSLPVKLFVSSSDENGVHDLFVECSVSRHDLGQYEVQADIRLYYHQALASISTKRKLDRWPLYDDIGSLVDMTSHLFIFASTVIDYVDNERYSPVKRLRSLLDCPPRDALDPLDRLYRIILEDAIQDSRRGRKDNHLCQRIRKLLSAIVFVQAPLRVGDLTRLLHMDEVELRSDLRALSSVVVLPDDGIHLVRIFHSSFADFLCDEHRCLDGDLRLDSQTEHAVMTRICIDLVSEFISNVCHLEHPGTTNSEVPLLDQLITQHLPRHVQYACRYWMVHAEKAYPLKQSLVERIQDVISTHIAPWIERCSLLQCLIDVNTDLKSLSECLKAGDARELGVSLSSIADFISEYEAALSTSALQVHITGPLFMPKIFCRESLPHEKTSAHSTLPSPPRLVLPQFTWPSHLSTILQATGASVCCVAVSSDEGLVAAGSSDNLIYVWDVATRNVQALQGHTGSVYAVSFSPDGKQLASGSKDTTVRRWDLTTYTEADVLDDHNGPVFSVTFAADNATIISGSEDQDVAIWNTRAWYIWDTRAYRQQKYHRHGVTAVINCTNGLLAASSDTNGTIQLWDASTSAFRHCATLRDPDQIPICCIVFSVDGKRLISGLTSGSIYLWDVHTREIHRRFTGHTDAINALEWPHGDKCFVSCSKDLTVRRWDTTTGQVVAVIRRQVVPVTDIVAFPDGRRFMTGSRDGRVHIFDRGKRTPLASRDLEPRRVKIVACSPDGALVAACSPDAILQIIDAHNGEVVAIFEGLEPDPTSLAFSPDSSQITMSYGNLSNDTWVAGYDFDRRAAAVHQSRGLVAFSCDDGGWIYYKRLVQGHEVRTRYCWIPPSHRWTTWSEQAAWAGNILAIGTDNGALSILDFELAWSEVS